MSHGFGNCTGVSAMRSSEDLKIFTVLSEEKNCIFKSVKLTLFLQLHMAFYF